MSQVINNLREKSTFLKCKGHIRVFEKRWNLACVIDVLFRWLGANDDVVQVCFGKLPFYQWQYNIHCVLRYAWSVSQSRCHTNKSVKFVMWSESCFATILLVNFHFSGLLKHLAWKILWLRLGNQFICPYDVRGTNLVLFQYGRSAVVNTQPQCSVFLSCKKYWCCPFSLRWFCDFLFNHFVHYGFSNSFVIGPKPCPAEWTRCMVWRRSSIWCFSTLVRPRCASHVVWNSDRISTNLSRYCEYLSDNLTFLASLIYSMRGF